MRKYDIDKFRLIEDKLVPTVMYRIYKDMKQRCFNPRNRSYHNYGGRGILVCDEWVSSFHIFLSDMGMRYVIGMEIDRIDNDLGYSKENCRFVTRSKNGSNRRPVKSKYMAGAKKLGRKWSSSIKIDQKHYHIGMFNTETEAHNKYKKIHKEWFGE